MKSKKIIIPAMIILLLLIVGICLVINKGSSEGSKENKKTTTVDVNEQNTTVSEEDTSVVTETTVQDVTNENMSLQVMMPENFVEPGEGNLSVGEIQGFDPEEKKIAFLLSDASLVVESVGGYTGNYIEDGSDEPIENVAALVITNKSDKILQVADIQYQVNENETASFWVTNLMPRASVLVMEASKREYNTDDDYTYGTVATAWLDSVSLNEELFSIVKEDGKLTLINNTDDTYDKVYVYYKYAQTGGAYLGGITYRVPFENIEGNASVESVANHFNKNTSRIIDVQLAE